MTDTTFHNDPLSRTVLRFLLILQLTALAAVVGLSLLDLFFLALVISFLTLFVFVAVILWLYVRYGHLPIVRQKRGLERLVFKFERNVQVEQNNRQAAIKERRRLFQAEKDEINTALKTLQRNHIENGLANASIKEAAIPGIGPKLKERLAGYGILSAAHVSNRIAQLPGFGVAKCHALLGWRSSVVAKLESTKPAALPNEQLETIKQKYEELQDKYNAVEKKALASEELLEHELMSLKPRLRGLGIHHLLGVSQPFTGITRNRRRADRFRIDRDTGRFLRQRDWFRDHRFHRYGNSNSDNHVYAHECINTNC